jgi:hypothetical protein
VHTKGDESMKFPPLKTFVISYIVDGKGANEDRPCSLVYKSHSEDVACYGALAYLKNRWKDCQIEIVGMVEE